MRKNISKRIPIFILAVLMVVLVVLSACDGTGDFPYPSKPESATPQSNGGVAVIYGDYLYYVNGLQSSSTATNKYTGEVKLGDIVRVSLEFLPEMFEFYDENHEDDEFLADLEAKVFAEAEVVVPKFYFSNNSTNKSVNGLWIFNDKLYFTTPNADLYTSGNVKNDQLCIYSSDLDGKNLTRLYTFEFDSEKSDNSLGTVAAIFKGSDNNVYTVYIDAESQLCYANLTGNKTEVVVSRSATNAKFDVASQSVIFVDNLQYLDDEAETPSEKNPNYKNICIYTLGDDEFEVLVEVTEANKDYETLTITQTNFIGQDAYVYYTIANTTDGILATQGLWMATTANSTPKRLTSTTTRFTSFLCYGEQIVAVGQRGTNNPQPIELYIEKDGDAENVTFIIPQNTNSDTITLNSINGSILSYTLKNVVYTVDLSEATLASEIDRGSITGSGWFDIDTVEYDNEVYLFQLTSSGVNVCKYVDDEDSDEEDAKKTIALSILVVQPAEED